jgi:glycosyltransferase involved in cell wall biosynthesis
MKPHSKKICMIAHRHAALDARIFYKEAKTLFNSGYEVHILLRLPEDGVFTDSRGKEVGRPDQTGQWHYEGIVFHGIKKRPRTYWGKFQEYRDMVYKGLELQADVYHCHETDISLAVAITIKKKLGSRTKFVFDSHEFWAGRWAHELFKSRWQLLFPLCKRIEKLMLKHADTLIASDLPTFGALQNYDLTKKILLLYNTVSPLLFDQSKLTNYLPPKNRKVLMIHNGGLIESRGIDRILRMLDAFDDSIVLACQGIIQGSTLEEKELVKKLIDEGKLVSLEFVSFPDVGKSILGADIGISLRSEDPNNVTACPNKIFNYMYAGLPIIADDYPGMADIIQKYRCGVLVRPDDIDALKQAVEYLIDYSDEAKAMGERGRQAVLGELSWEKHGQKLIEFYDQLLNPKPFIC